MVVKDSNVFLCCAFKGRVGAIINILLSGYFFNLCIATNKPIIVLPIPVGKTTRVLACKADFAIFF